MRGGCADMGHALYRARAGSDDRDALVGKLVEVSVVVAAGVPVIPSAGVEGVPLEILEAGNTGQLRTTGRPGRRDDEARLHRVVAVGADDPAFDRLVPTQLRHARLEAGDFI